jgi:NAD(P)-dependent dehydrogenase (short-subunit alcohol dehydrogenase family)
MESVPLSPTLRRFRLDGRVIVVTGASSGLGAAVAVASAEAGADLVLGARRPERLADAAKAVEAIGARVVHVPTDVRRPEDCERLAMVAKDAFGGLHGLVNSAGVASAVPALKETKEQYATVLETNLMGSYWMCQAAAPLMEPGGAVVNVASTVALLSADLPQAAYASAKSGLLGLTRDLAAQWGPRRGIRVNALAPGFFESELSDACPPGYLDSVTERTPLRRIASPADVAPVVVFLLSEASGYMSGATVVVDGGYSIVK